MNRIITFLRAYFILVAVLSLASAATARDVKTKPAGPASAALSETKPDTTKRLGTGGMRYSVQVRKFEDATPTKYVPPQGWAWVFGGPGAGHAEDKGDLGGAMARLLSDALQNSGQFILVADQEMREEVKREQDEAADSTRFKQGGKKPQLGRMTAAQLLVRGTVLSITENTKSKSSGFDLGQIKVGGGKSETTVELAVGVVNTTTGQVVASRTVKGISSKKDSKLRIGPWEQREKEADTFTMAAQNAILNAVDLITGQLDQVIWLGKVVLVKGEEIALDRGERDGVKVGQLFEVGTADELIDEDTGETLDWSLNKLGKLEVTRVAEKVAYCKKIDGSNEIEKGMTVTPAKE